MTKYRKKNVHLRRKVRIQTKLYLYRSAITGQFISERRAKRSPRTTVKEKV